MLKKNAFEIKSAGHKIAACNLQVSHPPPFPLSPPEYYPCHGAHVTLEMLENIRDCMRTTDTA